MMMSSNGNVFRVSALCAGNSPVTGEFPSQRPVTWSFDVFFDLRLNKRLIKHSKDASDLRRHCPHYDVTVMLIHTHNMRLHWKPRIIMMPTLLSLVATRGCHNDYIQCHEWLRDWHRDNSWAFSVQVCFSYEKCSCIEAKRKWPNLLELPWCDTLSMAIFWSTMLWPVLLKYGRPVAKCYPWIHRAIQGPTIDCLFGDQWIL